MRVGAMQVPGQGQGHQPRAPCARSNRLMSSEKPHGRGLGRPGGRLKTSALAGPPPPLLALPTAAAPPNPCSPRVARSSQQAGAQLQRRGGLVRSGGDWRAPADCGGGAVVHSQPAGGAPPRLCPRAAMFSAAASFALLRLHLSAALGGGRRAGWLGKAVGRPGWQHSRRSGCKPRASGPGTQPGAPHGSRLASD